ncbi:LysR family transcriptional regulator [Nocardioides sp. R-C-SC26]|uniref:LysR family transcriptional regulator n=1 Tax=Nocardioides sp. R-C-SC26 TaxID=2870414 RepID=UPI001E481C85|nr:LysR family transcriptional regulator [Nocardioides sp. R-C-SC26]
MPPTRFSDRPAELPDLGSLRLLTDVARLGSIGAAGRRAGISQQAASERLRTLEALTGLPLLARAARGSTLTEAGRLLVEWSAPLLDHADDLVAAVRTLREDRSRELHVQASMTIAEHLLPRWLVRLRQERGIAATFRAANTAGVLDAVRAGEADLGFIEGPGDVSGLATRVIGHDELVLVAAPDDAWARRRTPLTPSEIGGRALTSREPGSGTRSVWERALRAAGVAPSAPDSEATTTAAVLATVAAGAPPAFVSARVATRDVEVGLLVRVAVAGLDLRRAFTAVWVGSSRPPAGAVRDLLGIVQETTT